MGVSLYPVDGSTVSQLMKNSDLAMYYVKESGRNQVKLFTEEIADLQAKKLTMEHDLKKALNRSELSVHYQAKVDLNTHRIVGAETLLRWKHPVHGMISPVEFILLAEECGAIVPIGEWVLREVCRQISSWKAEQIEPVPIAINISAKQISSGELISVVSDCLKTDGVCFKCIELELTESVLMKDTALVVETLNRLEKMGIKVNLDDFGTGYSSLSYLKRFPISTLKIDQSFIRDIETDKGDRAIVEAILSLSKSLGLKVIAEGVETELQMKFLQAHGCDQAQGYLFANHSLCGNSRNY